MYPDADIPVLQLSLPTLDPTRERAASPLTDTSPRFGGSEVADDGGPEGTGTDD